MFFGIAVRGGNVWAIAVGLGPEHRIGREAAVLVLEGASG